MGGQRGAQIIIFVFDLCKKETFNSIDSRWLAQAAWARNGKGIYECESGAVAYLIGNKLDRTEYREVSESEAILYAHSHGNAFSFLFCFLYEKRNEIL